MAVLLSQMVRKPQWSLLYLGSNITGDISSQVLSVEFVSHLSGHANELQVELEDRNRNWQGPWYPSKGDLVNLQIGYAGEELVSCGDFQVDELEASGAPDVMHLRCIAAYITDAVRTRYAVPWEGQTLTQIATQIAGKYGFTVSAAPELDSVDISYNRVTQAHETDLAFLQRLANDHGFEFAVVGTQLVFYARSALESQSPVLTISRSPALGAIPVLQRGGYRFKDKTHHTYKHCVVSYQDPTSKNLILGTADDDTIATGDTLKIVERVESAAAARIRAAAALHAANMSQVEATFSTIGDVRLMAGNSVAVLGFGNFDGSYLIKSATHRIARAGGYETTGIEARKVA